MTFYRQGKSHERTLVDLMWGHSFLLLVLLMQIGLFLIYLNGYSIVDGIKQYTFYLPDIQNNLATNFAAAEDQESMLSTLTTIFCT